MAGTKLASFPNSRIKPRPATRVRATDDLLVTSAVPVSIAPATPDRTSLTLFNRGAFDLRYQYATNVNILVDGFVLPSLSSVDLDSPEEVFAQAIGTDTTVSLDDGIG